MLKTMVACLIARMTGQLHTSMPHVRYSPHAPRFLSRLLSRRLSIPRALLVVTVCTLVHPGGGITAAAGVAAAKAQTPKATNATLPHPASEMRDAILAAVRSGKLADLKTALELNEMRPDISDAPVADPIAYFASLSKDRKGGEILTILDKILALSPAVVPLGRDIENNAIFVWPYLAERDLSKLTPQEDADLLALMPAEEVATLKATKRWAWWRLAIGADGTWHSFRREK